MIIILLISTYVLDVSVAIEIAHDTRKSLEMLSLL